VCNLLTKKCWYKVSVCCLLAFLRKNAEYAQERQGLPLNADLTVLNNSNIKGSTDETSDKSAIFSPQIQYLNMIDQHQFEFDYQNDFVVYKNKYQYQYNDNNHEFKLAAFLDHSVRINTAFTLSY
jgi:hypothetical protein